MGLPGLLDIQVLAADSPSLALLAMATVSCAVVGLLIAIVVVVVHEIACSAVMVGRVRAGDTSGLRTTMHWLLLLVCTII